MKTICYALERLLSQSLKGRKNAVVNGRIDKASVKK